MGNGWTKRLAAALLFGATLATRAQSATPAQIDASIHKAIEFLYTKQRDGHWENVGAPPAEGAHDSVDGGQWGGQTGIAAYALLSAGQNARDPRLVAAVDFLAKAPMRGTYAVAARAQVWPLVAGVRDVKEPAKRDCQLLLNGVKSEGNAKGMWFYFLDNAATDQRGDHSASQFAVLGVWACAEAGIEVPDQFWKIEDAEWRKHQVEGGWAYVYQDAGAWGKPVLSMTVAGLATLFITQDKINDPSRLTCAAVPKDNVIARGLERVGQQFPGDLGSLGPDTHIGGEGRRNLYLLYGIQRLGHASGYRYFGKPDWFKAGSEYLVKAQNADGSWGNVWETSLALLFLSRSRAPVAFNKLEYSPPGSKTEVWNQRPREIANITQWMAKQMERRLNWQIVNVDTDPMQWLDAPALYIGGDEDPAFNDTQKKSLKAYVEAGGMIIGNADCGNAKFASAFKKLGKDLFPGYEFRELPVDHPVYTRQQFKRDRWRVKPRVLGLSNGARELMLLIPENDIAKAWQGQQTKQRIEHFELAADVYQYAAGSGDARFRGDNIYIAPDLAIPPKQTARVARLIHDANWDPEPGAWRRLAAVVRNERQTEVTIEPIPLGQGKLTAPFKLAHLTGTGKLTLSDQSRNELKAFIEGGGTLLVDAAGGSAQFVDSAMAEMHTIFAADKFEELPADAPMLTTPHELKVLTLRAFAVSGGNVGKPQKLSVIMRAGRPAVIFSSLDLTVGLVGNSVDGINGYDPKTAIKLVTNILAATSAK